MKINELESPKALKKLKIQELEELSESIREEILKSVSTCGGHLSSNLGIVELTLSIYKNFNPPKDKIIFDVGHQSYTQKMITGRLKDFNKLRKYKGLSGFQKRNESIYDCYEAGHSSTSISAALGMAYARDIQNKDYEVIAIIGDGSISNGLAYEAMNQLGELQTKVIVILNDNEMSINENIGAIHNYLDKIRSGHEYQNAKERTKGFLNHIPLIGKPIRRFIENSKESLKSIYLKKGYFFEEMGFSYYGPINGHDFKELNKYMEIAKKERGPVLLHVITEKGKGYEKALLDPSKYHGTGPFDLAKGVTESKEIWSNVICDHLINLAKINKKLMVITPAMASGSKLIPFKEKYKKRFIDVGIAEEHALVLANGLSLEGMIPFVSIYSTFLQRGYDEIIHDIARMNTHVIIGIDRAGIVGADGETHQGIYDVSFLLPIPNLIITCPKDSIEAGNLLYTATETNKPFCIRYSKEPQHFEKQKYEKVKIGSWEILKEGHDAYIITYGEFINEAKKIINETKYDIGLINARFIKPIDEDMMNSINIPIFTYEEVTEIGSLGSYLKDKYSNVIETYAIPDKFIAQGKRDELLKEIELDYLNVKERIEDKLKKTIK
jgi:1-deoxy-D-xylulose-5-phosphate synthase